MNTPTLEEIDAASSKLDLSQHRQPCNRQAGATRRTASAFISLGLTAWVLFLPLLALSEPYRVKRGDSLSTIAHRYGVSVRALKAANANKIHNVNQIHVGQVLTIPEGLVRAGGGGPMMNHPRPPQSDDSTRIEALRRGLDEGWVVTRNPAVDSHKIFDHKSMAGGVLTDLQYLVEESADGSTWTVYEPRGTVSGSRYGRRVGVILKPTNVSIGDCNCM